MDIRDFFSYIGIITIFMLFNYWFRHFSKITFKKTIASKVKSKQIRLTRSQVMEVVCNLAKTSARSHENAQRCVELVEKYKLDVNAFIPQVGLTIFLCSCIGGDPKLLQILLSNGADVRIKSDGGDSPLYLSIAGYFHWPYRHFKIFRQLIDAGCYVNDCNAGGYTALHLAASQGDIKLIEFLLDEGANPAKETYYHTLPIDMAIEAGYYKAAELLRPIHHPRQANSFQQKVSTPMFMTPSQKLRNETNSRNKIFKNIN